MTLLYIASTIEDGPMKTLQGDGPTAITNRQAFLRKNDIDPANATLLQLTYGGGDYCRYQIIVESLKGDGIVRESTIDADAVIVTETNHAILLPLADCIGAVIHDPAQNILMVSHLGRHNLEQQGGTKCIEYLVEHHSSNPKNLTVWLSPAAGQDNYPLYAFDHRGLHDVATEQLVTAGINPRHITASPVDTTTDLRYFSHSQFLAGKQGTDGRFCIVATMEH